MFSVVPYFKNTASVLWSHILHHKKKIILVLFLVISYGVAFIYRYELETYATFPGVAINTLEYTRQEFERVNLEFEDINIPYKDENIHGIYINNDKDKTIYYFHGNGGDISYFYGEGLIMSQLGYNLLILEYPGYGKSSGFPYAEDVMKYAEVFYEYVQEKYKISSKDTILWGYSIGTGVALEFAQGKDFYKLVLEAPYTSRYDLSKYHYGFIIQKLFSLPNSLVSSENIKNIEIPLLIIHGQEDDLVPFMHGKKLYNIAKKEVVSFIDVPDGDHFNLLEKPIVVQGIRDFLRDKSNIPTYSIFDKRALKNFLSRKYIYELDLDTDSSIQKFVNPDLSFIDIGYVPSDMEKLDRTYIADTKGNAQMIPEAKSAFEKMAQAFYEEFDEKVVVVSSYRSYNYQAGIKARGCPDNLCAKAGHSEHQSGLTVDLWSASTDDYWKRNERLTRFYVWLDTHAHEYGFHNTYQKGREIDGYEIEPWHWRYLGVPLATHLRENNITFAEFFRQQKREG